MTSQLMREQLAILRNPEKAIHLARFFKTGPGQYGAGDIFWGIPVPAVRSIAKAQLKLLPQTKQNPLLQDQPKLLSEVHQLIQDEVHEVRLCALLILVESYKKASPDQKQSIINCYLQSTPWINNWDLVDLSTSILGDWLLKKDRSLLLSLAQSSNMWEQRIAVVSTHTFIKHKDFTTTLELCTLLLQHPHDLMHKAMGWMLREVGKKNMDVLKNFLEQYWNKMPRTMFRYALEHFPKDEYQAWLKRGK